MGKNFNVNCKVIENWDEFSFPFLSKLSNEAKKDELIFFVSAGPAANVIISYLVKINNRNIYIDFGSAIEFITKGYSTRSYFNLSSVTASKRCERFFYKNQKLIYEN